MTDGVETEAQVEPAVDDAVVAEGQATDQSVSPWDSWIQEQQISEIAQAPVRAAFKHADGLATKKFQEHAEERKRWEPYESLGLNEFEPDFLSGALPIMRALDQGGDDAREIVERMARQLGLLGDPDDGEGEWDGEELEGDEEPDDDLHERLARTESFVQQQEEQQRRTEAEAYIAQAYGAVEKDLGRKLTDGETGRISNLASGLAHAGVEDPIGAAWKELKSQREDAQKELLEQKRQEPGRVEVGPSAPAARAPRPSGLSLEEQSNDRLREWMRSNGITD